MPHAGAGCEFLQVHTPLLQSFAVLQSDDGHSWCSPATWNSLAGPLRCSRPCLQGEDADEARERPAWMNQVEGAEDVASPSGSAAPSVGLASAPGTATAADAATAANGAADLLDLLGEVLGHPEAAH